MDFGNGKTAKLQSLKEAEGLSGKSLEEAFFFVFVCKGSKSAYKQIEEFIKGRTTARLIFQRLSKNYLSVSEMRLRPLTKGVQ